MRRETSEIWTASQFWKPLVPNRRKTIPAAILDIRRFITSEPPLKARLNKSIRSELCEYQYCSDNTYRSRFG